MATMVVPVISPPTATLYVGDLDPSVNEDLLCGVFSECGNILSIRVCRDKRTGNSLRYAYVNFFLRSHAEKALKSLNHAALQGKPMRIMWSQRNPISRKTGEGNVFVKNLDAGIDGAKLEEIFSKHGQVLSCKVATGDDGVSKGFGFVQFQSESSAQAAVEALHDSQEYGAKKLYVAKFLSKSMRPPPDFPRSSTLFIKNLDDSITEDVLLKNFSKFGEVRKTKIVRDPAGSSRGFGFVSFEKQEASKNAIQATNGTQLGSKTVFVGRALSREEREKVQKRRSEGITNTISGHPLPYVLNSEIFVKNFHPSTDDNALREIFGVCGGIRSATVVVDDKGASRGFGFVAFFSPESAWKAISMFNGSTCRGRRLYVALARGKVELRKAIRFESPLQQLQQSWRNQGLMMGHEPWMTGIPYGVQPMQMGDILSGRYQMGHALKINGPTG